MTQEVRALAQLPSSDLPPLSHQPSIGIYPLPPVVTLAGSFDARGTEPSSLCGIRQGLEVGQSFLRRWGEDPAGGERVLQLAEGGFIPWLPVLPFFSRSSPTPHFSACTPVLIARRLVGRARDQTELTLWPSAAGAGALTPGSCFIRSRRAAARRRCSAHVLVSLDGRQKDWRNAQRGEQQRAAPGKP